MRLPPRAMPALITPFTGDGAIDDEGHRHNAVKLASSGVEGFVVAGSTGLGPYLLPGERELLVGAVRDSVGADPFVACGVQAESVAQALAQAGEARRGGADAAVVMTPTTLIRGRDDLVISFYREFAAAAPLPVLLYSVPSTTGYQLPVEAAAELATHPGIAGMKDSGAGADRVAPLSDAIAAGFVVMAGSSRMVNAFVAAGAHGAITASANYAHPLVDAACDDERSQARLTALASVVEGFGLAGTYAAAEAAGLIAGAMRRPLEPLAEADREAVVDTVLGAQGS